MKMTVEQKREHEKVILGYMIDMYCKGNHKSMRPDKKSLCPECQELSDYALFRTDKCPFMETKSFCSACKVHCYNKEHKERIRQVMRYCGPRMLYSHPILTIKHAVITIKARKAQKEKEKQNV